MRDLYVQIRKDIAKSKKLRELAIDESNYNFLLSPNLKAFPFSVIVPSLFSYR